MAVTLSFAREPGLIVRTATLSLVARSHSLRCDAKQAEKRFVEFDDAISAIPHFSLGDYLPDPLLKGVQPTYLQSLEASGVPVVSTLAVQSLALNVEACRYISEEDYESLDSARKLRDGDVLLTMDGGTSIGKPALFDLEGDFTVDSHVAILRPVGLDARVLVYLLASPIGQLQFQQAESGASGQTSVTEEDLRRFRFPLFEKASELDSLVAKLDSVRTRVHSRIERLRKIENGAWLEFNRALIEDTKELVEVTGL